MEFQGTTETAVRRLCFSSLPDAMSDILIVRQPVFDRAGSAVGYELRFRPVVDEGDPFARSW